MSKTSNLYCCEGKTVDSEGNETPARMCLYLDSDEPEVKFTAYFYERSTLHGCLTSETKTTLGSVVFKRADLPEAGDEQNKEGQD